MFRLFPCYRRKKPEDKNDLENPLIRNSFSSLAEAEEMPEEEMDVDARNREKLRIMLALNFSRDGSWTWATVFCLNWKFQSTDVVDYGLDSQQMGQQVLATLAMLIAVMGFIAYYKMKKLKIPAGDLLSSFVAAASVIYLWDYAAELGSAKGKEWFDLSDESAGNFAALWTALEGTGQLIIDMSVLWLIKIYYSPELARCPKMMDIMRFFAEAIVSAMPFAGGLPGAVWQLVYNNRYQLGTMRKNRKISAMDAAITSAEVATGVMTGNYVAAKVTPRIMNCLFPPKPLTVTLEESDQKKNRGSINSAARNAASLRS